MFNILDLVNLVQKTTNLFIFAMFLLYFYLVVGSNLSAALIWGRLLFQTNRRPVRLLFEGGSNLSAAVINVITVCNFLLQVL